MSSQRCAWCWQKLTRHHECEGMLAAIEDAMHRQVESLDRNDASNGGQESGEVRDAAD